MEKTVVITGGSGGLGKSLLGLFIKNGDTVCPLSRTDGGANHFYCDVSNEESVKAALSAVGEKYGGIDILICNAGVGILGFIGELPAERVKDVFDVNFFGALYTIKYALPYMNEGAKIINISSVASFFALPYRSFYSASKAALNMMSLGLYMELSDKKIKCVSVCPGEIQTGFVKNRIEYSGGGSDSQNIKAISEDFVKKENKRMPVEKAAAKIFNIIDKKNLKPLYIIGAKSKLLYFAGKLLPLSLLLKFTGKKYGGKTKA